MLLAPRRLPRRFNRRVSPATARLVRNRRQRRTRYAVERWRRFLLRLKRRLILWRMFALRGLIVTVSCLLLLVMGVIFFSPIFTLREIRVRRTEQRVEQDLVYASLRPLIGRRLFFFSAKEVVPLLTQKLPESGRAAVPDLRSAEVRKDYPASLVLQITLDPIIARLTIENPDTRDASASATATGAAATSDYLTDEGMYVAYLPSQVQSGAVLPLVRVVDWGARPEPWRRIVDAAFLENMQETETALREQFGHTIRERTVFLRAREFHLKTQTITLWFDMRSSVEEQLNRYRLYLRSAGPNAAAQYVDLRLRDRIIYR